MRKINFGLADGYPLRQETLDFMQEEMRDNLLALIYYWAESVGSNNFIITGVEKAKNSNSVTPGWVWVSGRLLYYPGGTWPGDPAVIRPLVTKTALEYEDGNERDAWEYYTAQIITGGSGEGALYSSCPRVPLIKALKWANIEGIPASLVFDQNYVHTDNNFTNELLQKLMGIANGAEVNVQSDWNETNQNSDAFIKNKPTFLAPKIRGKVMVGDVKGQVVPITTTGQLTGATMLEATGNDARLRVEFPTLSGAYTRIVNIVSGGSWQHDNDVFVTLGPANPGNFEIYLREASPTVQNIQLEVEILQ